MKEGETKDNKVAPAAGWKRPIQQRRFMKKDIFYRSPVRGHNDDLINEPTCVYFGFTERMTQANLSAMSDEITARMEAMQKPCVVDEVTYVPVDDRPIERYEVFPPDSTDVLVLIRVPFRAASKPSLQASLN